jgi:hypothetical protein
MGRAFTPVAGTRLTKTVRTPRCGEDYAPQMSDIGRPRAESLELTADGYSIAVRIEIGPVADERALGGKRLCRRI